MGATGSDLDYQWLKDSEGLTEGSKYSGTMTEILTVIDVIDSDDGEYECIVGNVIKAVFSKAATLRTRK